MVVARDANVERAARAALRHSQRRSSCIAVRRCFVDRQIAGPFLEWIDQ